MLQLVDTGIPSFSAFPLVGAKMIFSDWHSYLYTASPEVVPFIWLQQAALQIAYASCWLGALIVFKGTRQGTYLLQDGTYVNMNQL